MATTNIELDIENITGVSDADDQFIISAQKFVVSSVPKNLLHFAQKASSASTDGSAISFSVNDSITDVQRNGYSCKEISMSESIWALDSTSLKYATAKHPSWYHKQGAVHFAPVTDGSNTGYVFYVDYSLIDDDCDLRNAVIFHACAKEFTQLATSAVPTWSDVAVPIAPTAPDFGSDLSINSVKPSSPTITASTVSFSQTAPTYTKPTLLLSSAPSISNLTISANAPTTPLDPVISGGSVTAVTVGSHLTSAPNYISPTTTISSVAWATEYPSEASAITIALTAINANVDLANATVDVVPVPPDSPTLSTGTSVSFSTSAPVYTAPAITTTGSDSTSVDLTKLDTATWTALDYDFDDENIDPLKWFQVAGDMIQNEEDPELAQVQLQKIATYIQAYSTAMQNQLNKFNDANAEYQIEFQKSLKNADFDNEEDARLLQKYQAELGVYQGEIAAMSAQSQGYLQTAQGYVNEVQARLSSAQIKVSEYQARVKDALNVFNKENAVYQAAIQTNIQQAQIDMQDAQKEADLTLQASIQDYTLELQLFQQEIAKYQAQVNDEVQEYQQNLQADLQVWQAERQTDLQKYASDIQNELNEYNKENAVYQVELKKSIENAQLESAEEAQKLQKYSGEIQSYQADVNKEVQDFTNTLSKEVQEYQSKVALYTADLQKYQAEVASETQKTALNSQKAQVYAVEADKYYKWAVAEVQSYVQNNSKMIGMQMAAQSQQRR